MKFSPTNLFISLTALLLMGGFLAKEQSLDIQLHDTYYVINYQCWLFF